MSLQSIINGPVSLGLARSLAKRLPPEHGYAFGEWLADRIAGQKNTTIVRALRSNQWVIHDGKITSAELDHSVRETLREASRCIYTYFHYLEDPQEISNRVDISPAFFDRISAAQKAGHGILWVTPHISNFDLVGRALAQRGVQFQVLSYPDPGKGYRQQNKMRVEGGLEITPFTPSAFSQARKRLSEGGMVLTGLDRPLPDPKHRPVFFGRPSAVPVAYIRLALHTRVPVILGVCQSVDRDHYRVSASLPIMMEPDDDPGQELIQNAEKVLSVAETYIRQTPLQWLMYYPVWPDLQKHKS